MNLADIQAMWEQDSQIDRSELGIESLKGPRLHGKYWKIYSAERMQLKRQTAAVKQLTHRKFIFYSQGPTRETQALGWQLPPAGKILKGEAREYAENDQDVVEASLALAEQGEKVEYLESIIKALKDRSYAIKTCLDWLHFTNGQ